MLGNHEQVIINITKYRCHGNFRLNLKDRHANIQVYSVYKSKCTVYWSSEKEKKKNKQHNEIKLMLRNNEIKLNIWSNKMSNFRG